jgi:hypothetical protein
VLATPLLLPPIYDFEGMSGFEPRVLHTVASGPVINIATHSSNVKCYKLLHQKALFFQFFLSFYDISEGFFLQNKELPVLWTPD